MAATGPLQNLKAEVTCPICQELFRDPVTSECGHSFCRECIARHCQGDGDVACPLCNEKLRKGNLRPNRELKNIVQSLRSHTVEDPRRGTMCETHQQPLLLYCQEDETPICLVCERCRAHRGHTVVPMEDAVQEHWETLTKQLAGMESTYEKVHPLVSMDQKHLSPSAGEEVHKRLKRLADSTATLFKVDTEGQGQRFEAPASQPQPHEPDRRGRGRGVATRSELRECQGREPGSEPAAEKQEETGTHVDRVCEEAPTPKYGLDQASLDPAVHKISDTTESTEPKVDVKSLRTRFQALTPVKPGMGPGGSGQVGVSAVPERGAARGCAGPGGEAPEKQEETETPVGEEAAAPRPVPRRKPQRHSTIDVADAPSRGDSPQDQTPVKPGMGPGGSGQVGVSAVPERCALRGRAGPGREAPEKQEATETPDGEEAAPLRPVLRIHRRHSTTGVIRELRQVDVKSRIRSLEDWKPVSSRQHSGRSGQVGVSPGGRVARPPELQGCAVEVTLDPATAHPQLVLSEDRKSAERGNTWQDLPDNPERFDISACVLGSEGFTSGRRYWEVEVRSGGRWAIGVARDSVQRKGWIQLNPDEGIWALDSLYVSQVPRKVGVYLDYEGGEVRFYNAETMALISSRTATFTGRLVPFFHLRAVGSRLSLSPCQR